MKRFLLVMLCTAGCFQPVDPDQPPANNGSNGLGLGGSGGSGGSGGGVASGTGGGVAAGTGGGSVQIGGCGLEGTWDGVSPAYNNIPETKAAYVFAGSGVWYGGTHGSADPAATEFMRGTYGLVANAATSNPATVLRVNGANMGIPQCLSTWDATYAMTVSADCKTLVLRTVTDNCTGGRHYLSASGPGSTLQRR